MQDLTNNFSHLPLEIQRKIAFSQTSVFKAVFPNDTNHYDTLFGGVAMQLMDEVAFIAATRFCRKRLVTVSTSQIDFKIPIPAGTIIEVSGAIIKIGTTSIDVKADIYVEEMYREERHLAVSGKFTFVAIDEDRIPVSVL